ncbi:MAG: hypothetical protein KZQ56_10575, partial [gamma proteobacterium symbiont of Lucinoma myriamae]|nr:hypothetical protein [gamma proteobacterium symbiont of Lucinoma myriamae]
MRGFVEGDSRKQSTLLPDCLDDYIAEENPVRVIDVFLDPKKRSSPCNDIISSTKLLIIELFFSRLE